MNSKKKGIIYTEKIPLYPYGNHYIGIGNDGSRVETDFYDWCGMLLYVEELIKNGLSEDKAYDIYWKEIAEVAGVSEISPDDIDSGKYDEFRQIWVNENYRFDVYERRNELCM